MRPQVRNCGADNCLLTEVHPPSSTGVKDMSTSRWRQVARLKKDRGATRLSLLLCPSRAGHRRTANSRTNPELHRLRHAHRQIGCQRFAAGEVSLQPEE